MKKKKIENVVGAPLLQAMGLRRRRNQSHLHHMFPAIPIISGALLFLFAVLSLLAPSLDNENLLLRGSLNDEIERQTNANSGIVLRVPAGGGSLSNDLWSSRLSKLYYGCSNASDNFNSAEINTRPNRYLMISTSGGLNQQRTGITDAVVAARILNATLVVPKLDQKSFWKDASNFSEIFDVDWFVSFLSKDVKVIKELPTVRGKVLTPFTTRVPRKCTPKCYQNRILPLLVKRHAVRLTKFDYRLANKLDMNLQKLRCRVNYHALKFTYPILEMGKKLVDRMRLKSKHFIALHLRFEPDMLAFSGCYYGGGEKERAELGAIRKRWKTLHTRNPDKERRQGKCPLTPEEVGLMLRALGFGSDVHIYVASGEVYGGEESLAPLKALFPNIHSKDTIATREELVPLSSFSSRMAALDFTVCDESDVFVTNNNGNMARILAGRRRYFGHKPTIRPNAKKMYKLFMRRNNMTWETFASGIRTNQIGFMGEPNEMKPGKGEFHENPSACICVDAAAKPRVDLGPQSQSSVNWKTDEENKTRTDSSEVTDVHTADEEQDWSEPYYLDHENGFHAKELSSNGTDTDFSLLHNSEQPELEEIFSD